MGEVVAKKGHKKVVTITWKYAAGDESVKGFTRSLRERRRPGRQGAESAVPERRVPGAADRDRGDQARCGLHLLRRRRRRQVRQGLRRGGSEEDDPAVWRRLPHRRHARSTGRRRRRAADHAALRRQPGHAARQGVPPRLRQGLQVAARCLRGAGLRRSADARHRPQGGQRRRQQEGRASLQRWRRPRSTARAARSRSARATTRCRTSTCARSSARRTSSIGVASKSLADPGARLQDVRR